MCHTLFPVNSQYEGYFILYGLRSQPAPADHILIPRAEVKHAWSYNSIPHTPLRRSAKLSKGKIRPFHYVQLYSDIFVSQYILYIISLKYL